MPQEGLPDPAATLNHPAAGFISEAAHALALTALRREFREFSTDDLALQAIRQVVNDRELNNDATCSLVRSVLVEAGWGPTPLDGPGPA